MAAAAVDREKAISAMKQEHDGTSNGSTESESTGSKIDHEDFWKIFPAIKAKDFTDTELDAFKKPFDLGWKREVVMRGRATQQGKKIGDVYYLLPEKKIKLRSYVEMGIYLKKNPQMNLEPANFTFARQPVFKPPHEIIRHAMSRGTNMANEYGDAITNGDDQPIKEVTPKMVIVKQEDESNASMTEGRAKRKRVAPTRFEDEEYLETPAKKKTTKQDKEKVASPVVASSVPSNGKTSSPAPSRVTGGNGISKKVVTQPDGTVKATGSRDPGSLGPIKIKIDTSEIKKGILYKKVSPPTITSTAKGSPPLSSNLIKNGPSPSSMPAEGPELKALLSSPAPKSTPIDTITSAISSTPKTQNNASLKVQHPSSHINNKGRASSSSGDGTRVAPLKMPLLKPKVTPSPSASTSAAASPASNTQNTTGTGAAPKPKARSRKPSAAKNMTPMVNYQNGFEFDLEPEIPRCSVNCGQMGEIPTLSCDRCYVIYHQSCVSTGCTIGGQYVCPNCLTPEEKPAPVIPEIIASSATNGNMSDNDSDHPPFSSKIPALPPTFNPEQIGLKLNKKLAAKLTESSPLFRPDSPMSSTMEMLRDAASGLIAAPVDDGEAYRTFQANNKLINYMDSMLKNQFQLLCTFMESFKGKGSIPLHGSSCPSPVPMINGIKGSSKKKIPLSKDGPKELDKKVPSPSSPVSSSSQAPSSVSQNQNPSSSSENQSPLPEVPTTEDNMEIEDMNPLNSTQPMELDAQG